MNNRFGTSCDEPVALAPVPVFAVAVAHVVCTIVVDADGVLAVRVTAALARCSLQRTFPVDV